MKNDCETERVFVTKMFLFYVYFIFFGFTEERILLMYCSTANISSTQLSDTDRDWPQAITTFVSLQSGLALLVISNMVLINEAVKKLY